MVALLELPRPELDERPHALALAVEEMGQRLQAAYLPGAIPYLREREPELWAELNALDADESVAALLAYESLFLEGLDRYTAALCRKAA